VKNWQASCSLLIQLGMTCLITIARVTRSRTKRLLGVLWQLKYAAFILQALSLDDILIALLSNVLHVPVKDRTSNN